MSKRVAEEEVSRKIASKSSEGAKPNESVNDDAEMGEFEDPYGDEFESEEEIFEAGDEEDEEEAEEEKLEAISEENESAEKGKTTKEKSKPVIYLPNRGQPLGPDEVMEPDLSTYNLLHNINVEWPCLSFDIFEDNLGDQRRGYPQTLYLATGTQAQKARNNEITVMKLSSLSKTLVKDDNEDSEDEDDDEIDSDPVLESKTLPTQYTTNRVRVNPHARQTGEYFTASMSECGDVYIWDLSPHFRSFDTPGTVISKQMNRPAYTIDAHGRVEGYALDWSPLNPAGSLVTGDISGRIHLTTRSQSGWTTDRTPFLGSEGSVEELQWSRSEKNVFASGGSDGFIRIWDTRSKKHKPALSVKATDVDINVMSWNSKVSYLLASGHDDGQWGVWDLRSFSTPKTTPSPVASFDFHKSAITSIEFNPNDESAVAVASEDNTVTLWDLSVEADDDEIKAQEKDAQGDLEGIPPQLLFVHWQRSVKEVHWHKQIPGTLVSTGGDGICVWNTISI